MFSIIAGQMGMLAVYVILGIIGVKSGVLNKDSLNHISRFIMKMGLPLMIFTSMPDGTAASDYIGALPVLGISACMYAAIYFMSSVTLKAFKVGGDRACVYKASALFGNVGFIGMPLILAACPGKGMIYMAVYTMLDQALLWTLGMYLTAPVEKRKAVGVKKAVRMMLNPAVIAIFLSLLFVLAGIKLPAILDTTLTKVGQTTTPLSMIYIGGLFCYMDIKKYIRKAEFYIIVVFKMIIFPILLFIVIGGVDISQDIRVTLAILAGLPTMSSVAMFANANGSDGDYAIGAIFITTIASVVTLPLISYIIGMLA